MIKWRSKPAAEAPPVLDTAYLERLQKHLGEDVTRELMADGMLELSDRLDRLGRLAKLGAVAELRKLTHDITGAAGHLGLSALSFYAAEASRSLHGDAAEVTEELMNTLLDYRKKSLDSLASFCKIGCARAAASATGTRTD